MEFGHNPTGLKRCVGANCAHLAECGQIDRYADFRRAIHVLEQKPRRVPDLIGERAVAFRSRDVESDVGAGRGHGCKREAHCVRPVLLDDLDGVDDVALGLGHLFAVGVPDQGVDVDLTEWDRIRERAGAAVFFWNVLGEPDAQHDHAGYPEEENVEAGN